MGSWLHAPSVVLVQFNPTSCLAGLPPITIGCDRQTLWKIEASYTVDRVEGLGLKTIDANVGELRTQCVAHGETSGIRFKSYVHKLNSQFNPLVALEC